MHRTVVKQCHDSVYADGEKDKSVIHKFVDKSNWKRMTANTFPLRFLREQK